MARIIVVDDSKLMRGVIQHLLEEAGHEVEAWPEVTAMEVTDRIRSANPSLVVTDYQMPGCNGLTLARMARKAKGNLPILMVTATHDPAVTQALDHLGQARVLYKPLKEEELLASVGALLGS